jgi:N utilization substance protein A
MSTSPIPQTLDILRREKGIDPQVIISAIEDAVVTAARKQFKTGEDLRARYNPETGDVELFVLMTVVDEIQDASTEITLVDVEAMGVEGAEVGDQLEFQKPREELARIAAQTAKEIIFQKVREAERNNLYDEYIDRVGELVHGFVKRFEAGRVIVDLGKIEAVLPKTQQSRAEAFSQGDRIRVVVNTVSKDTKGLKVEVSRTSPELLKRLFEMEVPEIYDGTVQVIAAIREPGDRAKIAVFSTERDVDPVGACVGMKGSRVQAIIRELRGERIDIIEWSEDPAVFAANALSPAKVSKVEINSFEEKKLTVTVPEDQLALAIGKKGQNVRLAATLVGWDIDIRSMEDAAQLEAAMVGRETTLSELMGDPAVETESLSQLFVRLQELGRIEYSWLEQICTIPVRLSKYFQAGETAEEFLRKNDFVGSADVCTELELAEEYNGRIDAAYISIVALYPSGALRSVPSDVRLSDRVVHITVRDLLVFLDPDEDQPTENIPSFWASITLFALQN